MRNLGDSFRPVPLHELEKPSEFCCTFRISTVQILLKARDMNIKAENFRRERVCGGEFLRAPDSLLPDGIAHAPIIRLLTLSGNPAAAECNHWVAKNIIREGNKMGQRWGASFCCGSE